MAVSWFEKVGSDLRVLNSKGELHNHKGPARIVFQDDQIEGYDKLSAFRLSQCRYQRYIVVQEWHLNGELHRVGGPALERPNGHKEWWVNGQLHREDGPAIEWASGERWWYSNGKIHREDGPAIERADGTKSWWLNGARLDEDSRMLPDLLKAALLSTILSCIIEIGEWAERKEEKNLEPVEDFMAFSVPTCFPEQIECSQN